MFDLQGIGKILIVIGAIIALFGVIFFFGAKTPFIGRLPGDIYIKKENFGFYFPITTSIMVSILLTLFFCLFRR